MTNNYLIVENKQIDVSALPQVNTISFTKAENAYLKIIVFNRALFSLILLIALLVVLYFNKHNNHINIYSITGLAIWILFATGNILIAKKLFNQRGFAVRENDIVFKKGWLFNSTTIIPYNKIQHINITVSIVERVVGLATLQIHTAAQSFNGLNIRGIKFAEAEKLKEFIQEKIKHSSLQDD
jgi:membrane protein YdbS with pleckstrin-like domain